MNLKNGYTSGFYCADLNKYLSVNSICFEDECRFSEKCNILQHSKQGSR